MNSIRSANAIVHKKATQGWPNYFWIYFSERHTLHLMLRLIGSARRSIRIESSLTAIPNSLTAIKTNCIKCNTTCYQDLKSLQRSATTNLKSN